MGWFTDSASDQAEDGTVVEHSGTEKRNPPIDPTSTQETAMNKTVKITASFLAVAALSAVLFTGSRADSMNSAAVATGVSSQSNATIKPLNSPETPQDQVKDLTY